MRKSQEDLLGRSIEGYLAIARSDLASEVENRQLRRLSFQLSKILSLSSSISRSSSRSVPVTIMVVYLLEKRQNYYSFDHEHHANLFCSDGNLKEYISMRNWKIY